MPLKFTKMHGLGNDYIYINCFDTVIHSPESLAVQLSDRHFGIGGDGIVLILPSTKADAKMRMFNIDGSEGKMCGNAIRCVAKYLYDYSIVTKENITIETRSGIKSLKLYINHNKVEKVTVDMGKAELRPENIPVLLTSATIIATPVTIGNQTYDITCVSMGNPHCVVFCHDVSHINLQAIGPLFEHNSLFPDRINTEFVEIMDKNHIKMRVWERGSGETMACGTGACASAVAAVLNGLCDKNTPITVELDGGRLTITYTEETVFMTGGCTTVFEGTLTL